MGPVALRSAAACALLAGVVVGVGVGVAQVGDDPRNHSNDYYDAVDGGMCADHHAFEGFRPFGVSFTEHYAELPVGEVVVLEVRVRHTSQMEAMHFVEDVVVVLNLTDAPNVRVVTADAPEDIATSETVVVPHNRRHEGAFQVHPGAVEGHVAVRLVDTAPGGPLTGTWEADAHGQAMQGEGDTRHLRLTPDLLASRGPGEWPLSIEWSSPYGPLGAAVPLTATFDVQVWVNHSAAASEYSLRAPEESLLRLKTDAPILVQVPIMLTGPGTAVLDFRVEAWTRFDHPQSAIVQNARDEGLFHRFITMQVTAGEELVLARQVVGQPVGPVVDLYNLMTRVLGFAALALVLTAMVTGGAFGRANRRALNRGLGGGRRRVLFHSAAGFLIVLVATAHFALAIVEKRNDISQGLFWGGVAWFLLVTLGFTGYYQTRMVKRFGYRAWRWVHLGTAIGVLAFVAVHVLLEGSALSALRDRLPDGHERLYWPGAPG